MSDVEESAVSLQDDSRWIGWHKTREFPKNIVVGGVDINKEKIYVGRATHSNCELVAKVIPTRNVAYVAFEGKEIEVQQVEVLLDNGRYYWEFDKDGAVPETAVKVGKTNNGETVYVGRAIIETSRTPGTILRFKGVLSIPFDGNEHEFRGYEVLCYKPDVTEAIRTNRLFTDVARVVCSIFDCIFRTKLAENFPSN